MKNISTKIDELIEKVYIAVAVCLMATAAGV